MNDLRHPAEWVAEMRNEGCDAADLTEAARLREELRGLLSEVDAMRAFSDRRLACKRDDCPADACADHDPADVWHYIGRVETAGHRVRAALDTEDGDH